MGEAGRREKGKEEEGGPREKTRRGVARRVWVFVVATMIFTVYTC